MRQSNKSGKTLGEPIEPPEDATHFVSGLVSVVVHAGSETRRPGLESVVKLRYCAWNAQGAVVLESGDTPDAFVVSNTIPGLAEALTLMRVGEKRRLWIPETLSYKAPRGPLAGRLIFDVELIAFEGESVDRVPEALRSPTREPTGSP